MTPTLVTPNDTTTLKALCDKAQSSINSHDAQISHLIAKITLAQEQQMQMENDLLDSAHKGSELASHLQELRNRHQQAMVSAGVAVDTPAQESTQAYVGRLGTEIEEQQKAIGEHAKAHKKLETDVHKSQYELQQSIDANETELAALRENRKLLHQSHDESHEQLGKALFAEVISTVRDMQETEKKLEDSLDSTTSEMAQYYMQIPVLLSEWPSFARSAVANLVPVVDEPLPAKVVADALLAYLAALEQHGAELKTTAWTNIQGIASLLSIPHEFTRQIASPTGLGFDMKQLLASRRRQIEDYVRQVEQENKSRKGW